MSSNQIANVNHAAGWIRLDGANPAVIFGGAYGLVSVDRVDVGEYVVVLEQPLGAPTLTTEPASAIPIVTLSGAPAGFTVQAGILPAAPSPGNILINVYDAADAPADTQVAVSLYVHRFPIVEAS